MAKKRENHQLLGAEEFAGPDTEKEAIEKIAAAKAAAETERAQDDNGGPMLDEEAWKRASRELIAEQIELDRLGEKVAEVRGRISSIKKVAEKCGVDWDVVKVFAKFDKRIRIGEMGAVVTEQRRLAQLMRVMDCPLHTQWGLFDEGPQDEPANGIAEPELAGQHAFSNNEPASNNPHQVGTLAHQEWSLGWSNAEAATARSMGPGDGATA